MYEVLWSWCVSVCGGEFMVSLGFASWGVHVCQLLM